MNWEVSFWGNKLLCKKDRWAHIAKNILNILIIYLFFLHLFIWNNKLIMLPIQKKTEFYFLKLMQYASVYTVYVLV